MGKLAVPSVMSSLRRMAPAWGGRGQRHISISSQDTTLSFSRAHCELMPACVCNSLISVVSGDSKSLCTSSARLQSFYCGKNFRSGIPAPGFACDSVPKSSWAGCRHISAQRTVTCDVGNSTLRMVHLFASLVPGRNFNSFSKSGHSTLYTCNVHQDEDNKSDNIFPVRTNTPQVFSVSGLGRGSQDAVAQITGTSLTLCQQSGSRLFPPRRHFHTFYRPSLQPPGTRLTGLSPRLQSLHTLEDFSLQNTEYRDYLESLVAEFDASTKARLNGESLDKDDFLFLETVAMTVKELRSAYAELGDLRSMISGESDKELQAMAKMDVDNTQQHIQQLEEKLVDVLVGPEPADKNDIMLEVSAGVGGQEAMLFTGEIFDMYASYASFKGWTFDTVDHEKSEQGGLRRASALITGLDVYKHLKFEAGVHRVQRVPKTEKSGRVHTSTMTVAVLPQPSQIDISVNPKDLQIDTFRAAGAGGQHVNTTDSAVRITHKPSGVVAECQEDRSQIKNKEKAMKTLLSRLYQKQVEEQETALRKKRKLQVGSAGRSEKIRTYNYSQDRITDHRGPITLHNVQHFLSGEDSIDDLINTLMMQSRLEVLQAMISEFLESRRHQKSH